MALDFGANKMYDLARDRAKQQEAANLQGQKDALARRAAQLGGGPSGAFIKQEQIAGDESAKRLGDVNEGINAQQEAEQRRLNEIEQGQKFQTSERLGSQDFAATQADIGRKFTTGERMGSQDFAAQQALLGRQFTTGEREASQKFATGERQASQTFTADQSKLARDLQSSQFNKQLEQAKASFDWEKYVDQKNIDLASRIQSDNEKGGFLEKLLGPILGGGSGAGMIPGLPGVAKYAIDPISSITSDAFSSGGKMPWE